jgi:Gamma-aminobutyrate permease and related permeases
MGIAIGQIIGAGIMSMTGIAIGMTGTGIVLAFLISAVLTLITIAPVAYLSAAVPTTGGAYRYTSRLLGKKCGFVFLVLFLITNCTLALYALTFASYWVSIWAGDQQLIAIAMLVVFYLVNLFGTKSAAVINTIICVIMVGGIMLFIGFGIPQVDFEYIFESSNFFHGGAFGFIASLALLSFASSGAQFIAEVGGETQNPGKTIPKVMVISTLGVAALYALMACVAVGVLPIEATANQPLTAVANKILPTGIFYLFIPCSAMGASASTMNSMLSWVSKAFLVACEDGLLPKSLATVSKRGVPYKILTIFFLVGLLPLLAGWDISFVSRIGISASLTSKLLVCIAFTKIYLKYPLQMEQSVLKISEPATKILGISAGILSVSMGASLILSLPTWAIISFTAIVLLAILYANVALKSVSIPDDLVVVYNDGKK